MRVLLATAAAVLLLAGCTSGAATGSAPSTTSSPFGACPAVSGGDTELPDVTLTCFNGGGKVRLADLSGPAVINIWASSCAPCRTELPLVQKLADRTAGKLTVLGVASRDRDSAAASFGAVHGISLPTLSDPEAELAGRIGAISLPSTVFINADGKMHVHRYAMDAADLTEQLREHTGLQVDL